VKLKPLADQVIVITGASSGIGLVTARQAAAKGAKVLLVARDEGALATAAEEIRAASGEADFAVADVGKLPQVEAAAEKAVARFGRIDGWVNNAGVAIYARLLDTPIDEHRQLFRTNYFGVVHGCTVAVAHLRRQGGALVTVASIASDIPAPVMGAYAASKHAVRSYVETLRTELQAAGDPISVTLVKPSGIDTPIARHAADHMDGQAQIPPPVYAPELVADVILHALEHPRREVTVGGAGRVQTLLAQAFPALMERLAPIAAKNFTDDTKAPDPGSNLQTPDGGEERSGREKARAFSLYTAAELHPIATAGVAGIGVVAAGLAWRLLRKPAAGPAAATDKG
jgi:short-subunit dehydrogenase